MTDTTDCLFCNIAAGSIPADVVLDTDRAVAFRDIDPKAPVHILIIPKDHYPNVGALADADPSLLAHMVDLAAKIAEDECEGQYRLVFNTGEHAGQSVFHVHGHILGGRDLTWPPG